MAEEEKIEKKTEEHYEDLISCYLGLLTLLPENPYQEYLAEKKISENWERTIT